MYWIILIETAIFSRNKQCVHPMNTRAMHCCAAQDTERGAGPACCVEAGASHNPVLLSKTVTKLLNGSLVFLIYVHCYNVYWIYFESEWFCLLSETVDYFYF